MIQIKQFFDIKLLIFCCVGVVNTLYGVIATYLLYTRLGFGYWGSTIFAYSTGTVLSYILNRKFTFKYREGVIDGQSFLRFLIVIAASYFTSFLLCRLLFPKIIVQILPNIKKDNIEPLTIVFAMCMTTALSYLGQRLYVFQKPNGEQKSVNP